ncbi:hypothetical protein WHI96_12955 [Pseudonocardia tropica]|uniref:Type I restriction enzyme R protein N-terminal domain-containing protein n=1 Tax=Pseudonocardia tropica TaxID=681289 RepID=A0ABV1JWI1_9PSEU
MNVSEAVEKALLAAASLVVKKAANEANTKALVIEPVLKALGWDTTDIDAVEREVQIYDGTFLDYALKIDGTPRVFVEAKSLSGNLSDKKFIAQAVNYANNSGVVWCVLTNGRRYRVFKSNEVAPMDEKLLFEVDLDDPQPIARKLEQLGRIAHREVSMGRLDEYGERVFTDSRIRSALSALAADPPEALLGMITEKVGAPAVAGPLLRDSLARVLDAAPVSVGLDVDAPTVSTSPAVPTSPSRSAQPSPLTLSEVGKKPGAYDLDWHLSGKARAMRELWESIDTYLMSSSAEMSRRVGKVAVNYFRGKKSLGSAQIRNDRVVLHLKLDPVSVPHWDDSSMRDVSDIGHWGNGDLEFSLTSEGQIEQARQLMDQAIQALA